MAPPPIAPVERDFTWSVMIPVFNCAPLLAELLPEVLSQLGDRDDVQIAVVDDASVDDAAAVVAALGDGRVDYHRNETGLGAIGNFNHCLTLARGEMVQLLHGDDGVRPGFYAAMGAALDQADVAVCRCRYIDDEGVPGDVTRSERDGSGLWTDALGTLAISNRVRPSAIVAKRSVYEAIGGFDPELPHAADWEMWARMAASVPVWWVDEVLALYRVHAGSDTAQRMVSGVDVLERLDAIEIISAHVDATERTMAQRKAAGYSALFALRTALRFARNAQWQAAGNQVSAAATCTATAVVPGRRFSRG